LIYYHLLNNAVTRTHLSGIWILFNLCFCFVHVYILIIMKKYSSFFLAYER
jgi:hypothetical protein